MQRIRIYFEVGIRFESPVIPDKFSVSLTISEADGTELDYQTVAASISPDMVLRRHALEGTVLPEDVKAISPEEYKKKYGRRPKRKEYDAGEKVIFANPEIMSTVLRGKEAKVRIPIETQPEDKSASVHKTTDGRWVMSPGNGGAIETEIKQPCQIGETLLLQLSYDADPRYFSSIPPKTNQVYVRVLDIRSERLQDIITDDWRTPLNIVREGLSSPCLNCKHFNGDCADFIEENSCVLMKEYIKLWNRTKLWNSVGKPIKCFDYRWDTNPLVWVITFESCATQKKGEGAPTVGNE